MKDLISIVVPIFNVEQYLEKCILSIINQTYKNLEIILVDDGSTDNCGEICDKFALMDSRIKVIHKANGGLSDARNEGIKISTGKYIGFVDSDDYIDQDMYSTLYDNMIKSGAQLSVCSRILVVDNVEHFTHYENKYKCFSNREALKDLFIRNEYLCHAAWDKLYSRDLWNDMEFPVGRLFEDAAVMYKIFEKCDKIVSTKKQLYYYVQRKGSISNCAYNEKKVRHQIENRINAINYYKNKNAELCILASAWNMRFAYNLWNESYPHDKDTAMFILRVSRSNFHFSLLKYLGKKQFLKGLFFCINPHILRMYYICNKR